MDRRIVGNVVWFALLMRQHTAFFWQYFCAEFIAKDLYGAFSVASVPYMFHLCVLLIIQMCIITLKCNYREGSLNVRNEIEHLRVTLFK